MARVTFAVAAVCALLLRVCSLTNGEEDTPPITSAYCKIGWLLGIPCDQVNLAIVTQMKAEASYKLVSVTPKLIQANHTSGLSQLDSVSFIMRSTTITQGCYLEGTSTSAIWFSLFDDNSNYCSFRNIITGSRLDKASGFLELTNDWLCLGCEQSAC